MKRRWILGLMVMLFFGISGPANAALTVIGAATYQGNDYNLIYMDDGPLGPITWLDYPKSVDTWQHQVDWALGLGAALTATLASGYTSTIDWETGWRLPSAGDDPQQGYNVTSSEMGHLYYVSLGKSAGGPLGDTSPFDDLPTDSYYWSGTEASADSSTAWSFQFHQGYQDDYGKNGIQYALAVRPGDVSAVPIPGTVLLLASGLAGLFGIGRKPGNS